jgi:hypothetical protein
MATRTVNVALRVTEFRDIKDTGNPGRFCLISRIVDQDITEDPVPAPGKELVQRFDGDDRTIRLKKPPVAAGKEIALAFTIFGVENYVVAGVIFNNRGLDTSFPAKGHNFEAVTVAGNKVTITNKYARGRCYWELYIAIQRSDGTIGLIDPGLENSDAE